MFKELKMIFNMNFKYELLETGKKEKLTGEDWKSTKACL